MADLVAQAAYGDGSPAALRTAVREFLESFVAAGWACFAHPKFHRCVHFADQLARWAFILGCWMLERKHKDPKAFASATKNLVAYEKTVLHETTCRNLYRLQLPDTFSVTVGLISAVPASIGTRKFLRKLLQLSHDECRDDEMMQAPQSSRFSSRGVCCRGDTVLCKIDGATCAAEVKLLVSCREHPLVILHAWDHVWTDLHLQASMYRVRKVTRICELSDIVAVCIYKSYPDNQAMVLLPYGCRGDCDVK